MIKRIWHGYTTPERADEYEALLKAEVIKGIEGKNIPGFWGIDVLRRPLEDEVEFITIMDFDTLDSVKAFVGEDHEAAYVPDEARAVLKRFDERSQHYDVREQRSYGAAAPGMAAALPVEPAPIAAPAPAGAAMPSSSSSLLGPNVWFVRKDRGNGSVPVTREGYKVAAKFVFGMFGWGLVAAAMVVIGLVWGPSWLTYMSLPFFVLGAFLSAWYFIAMARKHTDYSMRYSDYMRSRRNG